MPRRIRDAKIQNSRYGKQERLNKCKWTESDSTSDDLTGTLSEG